MHRSFNSLIAGLAVLAIWLSVQLPAAAEDHHPVLMAPGFDFDQVESLCVMPPIDARNGPQPINLDGLRPAFMLKVQEKGYRVLEPGCSHDSGAKAAQGAKSRWILTVRLDAFEVSKAAPNVALGSYLTASLYDTQTDKEVWRDTAKTGYGGRFASAMLGSTLDGLVESGFGAVLATFEKQKKPYPPSPATMWPPTTFSARLYKVHSFSECNGQLAFDSGTLSFMPSSNGKNDSKCASFRFSVQGAKFGAAMWLIVPGKGKYFLQQYGGSEDYLDLALRASQ
jgi:hypothetical protein